LKKTDAKARPVVHFITQAITRKLQAVTDRTYLVYKDNLGWALAQIHL
jgi:hypothetical protein